MEKQGYRIKMYTNTFRKIRPTLAAVLAGYTSLCSINIADAESGSTQVNVSATVVGPVEKEIKILDPQSSSPAQWEKAAPRSDNYTFEDDDYAWLDYTAPTTREATTAAPFHNASVTVNPKPSLSDFWIITELALCSAFTRKLFSTAAQTKQLTER